MSPFTAGLRRKHLRGRVLGLGALRRFRRAFFVGLRRRLRLRRGDGLLG